MKYIMRRHNVERMADTAEAVERLKKLGYEVKADIEPGNVAKEMVETPEFIEPSADEVSAFDETTVNTDEVEVKDPEQIPKRKEAKEKAAKKVAAE